MRVIYMGTPDFAVGTLEALITAGHDICLIVTQPDKPQGRSKEMQPSPVKQAAVRHGISVYQPVNMKDPACLEALRKVQADVIVVVAFGQILPKVILGMTPYGCINVHASLLPAYRGAAPIQWAIIRGETVTGVTTMQMDEGLDTGDMILKAEVRIDPDETGESLHDKLAAAGAVLCVETLAALEDGTAVFECQKETTTEYAKMLTKEMGRIDWSKSAIEIERLVRGLNSWPCAYTYWDGKAIKVWGAKAILNATGSDDNDQSVLETDHVVPGTVVKVDKEHFYVQTGSGLLKLLELQMPGKKRMTTDAFLRGYPIRPGIVLDSN